MIFYNKFIQNLTPFLFLLCLAIFSSCGGEEDAIFAGGGNGNANDNGQRGGLGLLSCNPETGNVPGDWDPTTLLETTVTLFDKSGSPSAGEEIQAQFGPFVTEVFAADGVTPVDPDGTVFDSEADGTTFFIVCSNVVSEELLNGHGCWAFFVHEPLEPTYSFCTTDYFE